MANKPFGLRIPNKGSTWVYDFQVEGQRYTASTKQTDYRKALAVATKVRAQALEGQRVTRERPKPRMPLREVMGRFYNEKAKFEGNHATVLGQLARLAENLGPDLYLDQLTVDDLLRYQTERRKKVSNRTVNAELVELLRRVMKRARMWGISVPEEFDWNAIKLERPAHRTRSASRNEQARLLCALRKDYRPIILFALKTGLRKQALLIKRSQIDWDAGTIWYTKKSKRTNDLGWLPITPRIESILRYEISKADSEWVFTYDKQRGGKGRAPITGSGLRMVVEKAVKAAGLEDWRMIHDLRHTAATETLRSSQNLAAVQIMLGHSDIGQTSRYAHVLMDDVRSAMLSREKPRETSKK